MGDHDTFRALPAIARAGTGIANIAPARSRTDPPAATQPSEHSHLHKRLHSNTITGRVSHHRHRSRAKETVQSAIDLVPPISFDHLLRRDRRSPDSSRRGSATPQQQREEAEWRSQQQAAQAQAEREARARVKPEHVAKARAENAKREEELRRSLKHVEELGMSNTRQLDDTYYAILEKAAILRSTVASLQALAEESRKMRGHFDEDAKKLEEDTLRTLDGFGGFDEQERTIDELVEKLKRSKSDTAKLNERLESARERVAAFERREKEKRSKRRKQWHATWGTLVGVLVLIIAVLVFKNRWHIVEDFNLTGELAEGVGAIRIPDVLQAKPRPSEDPYLHQLFDGL
ncbi:hypothetical protein B0A55_04465 [Friedmanniomyces simplex]|uniref:Uncharacterized protein n=1 Tax=Friedmanniomyces simplex TaxID=329884 RepID=A0A4V6WL71_9PEZI|nr:hypothetical protein B0A55_04465 [Friedmanniomyces simplex]